MYRLRMRRQVESGFTLIELLVVIAVLGILAGVVVFSVGGVSDKGKSSAEKQDERTLRTAEEVFRSKNGRYGTEQELVDGGFIQAASSLHDVILSPDQTSFLLTFQPEAGVPGGTLVVGETFVFPTNASAAGALTYNPASDTSGSTHAFWEIMYNGLLTIDHLGNPQAELATRVPTVANGDISNGGRTYRLILRDNVFWHDSTSATPRRFTAADVKFTFEKVLLRFHARTRNMAPLLSPPYNTTTNIAGGITQCTAAEAPTGLDPALCVMFRFTDPYAPLLRQLNVTEAAMNPAHLYTGTPTLAQLVANTVGTGPFQCFNPGGSPPCRDGTEGRVDKNPRYWRTGFPYLDTIRMRPITDGNTRTNALINGDVQWVWDVLETRAAEVDGRSNLRTAATQSLGGGPNSIDQLIFNLWDQGATAATINANTATPHPIFGGTDSIDPDGAGSEAAQPRGLLVRRAFSHALNRPSYLAARGNVGTIATAPISSELSAHANDIVLPGFDLAKAGALLEAAGWKDLGGTHRVCQGCGVAALEGQDLDVTMVCGSVPFCGRVDTIDSQLLLAKVNVVKVDCSTSTACGASSANVRVYTNRDFDLYILNLAQGYDPHVGVRRQYHSDQITDASAASVPNNTPGYKNAVVDAAFDNAAKTIDATERNALYHQFQEQAAKDLPYIWVIETPNVRGYTAACAGFREWTGLFAEFASCRR